MIGRYFRNEGTAWDALVALLIVALLALTLTWRGLLLASLDRGQAVERAQFTVQRALGLDLDEERQYLDYRLDGNRAHLARAQVLEVERAAAVAGLDNALAPLGDERIDAADRALDADDAAVLRLRPAGSGLPMPAAWASAVDRREADLVALDASIRAGQTALRDRTRTNVAWMALLGVAVALLVLGLIGVLWRLRAVMRRRRDQMHTMHRISELYAIGDMIDVLLWSAAPDGTITYLSRRWEDYTGHLLSDIMIDPWSRYVHPDDRVRTLDLWGSVLASGKPFDIEHRLRGMHGDYRWFHTRGVALRDPDDGIITWFGSCTDTDAIHRRAAEFETMSDDDFAGVAFDDLDAVAMLATAGDLAYDTALHAGEADGSWSEVVTLRDGRVFVSLGLCVRTSATAEPGTSLEARRAIIEIAHEEECAAAVLERLNTAMLMRRADHVAALCGYVDGETNTFRYATAAHEGPYLSDADGVHVLAGGGPPIGFFIGAAYERYEATFDDSQLILLNTVAAKDEQRLAQVAAVAEAIARAGGGPQQATEIGARIGELCAPARPPSVLTLRSRSEELAS